jgi:hypothetical protein
MVQLGLANILRMTRYAPRREALELPDCRPGVAFVASEHGMRANQREPVIVVPDGLPCRRRSLPAVNRMTLLALLPQLTLVNIRMAVRTFGSHVGKDQADVALGTRNILV